MHRNFDSSYLKLPDTQNLHPTWEPRGRRCPPHHDHTWPRCTDVVREHGSGIGFAMRTEGLGTRLTQYMHAYGGWEMSCRLKRRRGREGEERCHGRGGLNRNASSAAVTGGTAASASACPATPSFSLASKLPRWARRTASRSAGRGASDACMTGSAVTAASLGSSSFQSFVTCSSLAAWSRSSKPAVSWHALPAQPTHRRRRPRPTGNLGDARRRDRGVPCRRGRRARR